MVTCTPSKNEGKLAEIRTMLGDSPLELRTYPAYRDPEEGHESYVNNALLKRALRSQLIAAGIRDVAVWRMTPASNSMRWAEAGRRFGDLRRRKCDVAGALGDDDARGCGAREIRRGARFVCVMALILPDGEESWSRETCAARSRNASR